MLGTVVPQTGTAARTVDDSTAPAEGSEPSTRHDAQEADSDVPTSPFSGDVVSPKSPGSDGGFVAATIARLKSGEGFSMAPARSLSGSTTYKSMVRSSMPYVLRVHIRDNVNACRYDVGQTLPAVWPVWR